MTRLPDPASCRSNDPLQMVQTLQPGCVQGRWVTSMPKEQSGWSEGRATSATSSRQQHATAPTLRLSGSGAQGGSGRGSSGRGPRETEPTSYPSGATRLEGSAVEATLLVSDVVGVRRVAGVHVRWVAHLRGAYHSTT